jgi:bla regulator protein blaR1
MPWRSKARNQKDAFCCLEAGGNDPARIAGWRALTFVDDLSMIVDNLGVQMSTRHKTWNGSLLLVILSGLPRPATGQEAEPKPATFEVASVKANKSGPAGTKIEFQPKRVNLMNVPLRAIIQLAYGIQQPTRVVVPNWVNEERFDIMATSGEVLSLEQRRSMMQALLAERFQLMAHNETREQQAFALVLARNDGRLGPSLRHSTAVCSNRQPGRGPEPAGDAADAPQTVVCGVRPAGLGKIVLVGVPINLLASALSSPMGRTVFDKTGLTGLYDVELTFTPELPQSPDGPPAEVPFRGEYTSMLLGAIQDQLGLKLNSEKEKIDLLVVDRIERPSEN